AWVKPAGFMVSVIVILVTIVRWTGGIESRLDMLTWQMKENGDKVTSIGSQIETRSADLSDLIAKSNIERQSYKSCQSTVARHEQSLLSIQFRLRQIEKSLHLYEGGT